MIQYLIINIKTISLKHLNFQLKTEMMIQYPYNFKLAILIYQLALNIHLIMTL